MGKLERLRKGVGGAAALLLALLSLFFWRAVFLGESLLPADLIYELDPVWQSHAPAGFTEPGNRLLSDVTYFFYPWYVELQRALEAGRIPLWTSNINNGHPMLANGQTGMFDPFWLIARLFPLNTSFLIAALLKLWVGGTGTFLLARQLGISRKGALISMVAFTFSGPVLVWLSYSVTSVIVWLPLLLYLSERALSKPNIAWILVIGAVLAAQFGGGHPETSFHVVITWIGFCGTRAATHHSWKWRPTSRALSGMVLASLIGLGLAAIQLVPLAAGILDSSILMRRQANAPPILGTLMFDWRYWLGAILTILPQFWGTPMDNSYWYPFDNYNEQAVYAGILPLALGALAMLDWWRNRNSDNTSTSAGWGFFVGLTLLALGIALHLPLLNVVNVLPVLRLINHGRLRMVYALGLALLAGYGLDVLKSRSLLMATRILLTLLAVIAVVSMVSASIAWGGLTAFREQVIAAARHQAEAMKAMDHPQFPYSLEYYYDRINLRYVQMRQLYYKPLMFVPLLIVCAVGGLEWLRRRSGHNTLYTTMFIALTCADLFAFGQPLNPTMKPALIFPATPAIEFLQQQPGLFRVSGLYLALMPNSSMVFNLSDVRGFDDVVPQRQATLLHQVEGAFQLNHYALLRSADSPLLDLMNVEYMITDRELGGRWELAFAEPDSPIRVYRNTRALPRAFMVYQAEYARTPQLALERLMSDSFRTRVILEKESALLPASETIPEGGQVRIISYAPERVVIETETPADGFLVLSDSYAPGWRARVDGQPTEVYIANYTFRAVRVPAGQHRVEFTYMPPAFIIGAALSLVTLAACLVVSALLIYNKRQCKPFTI